MKNVSKEILELARKQLAAAGYKALKKKYTAKQLQQWRLKGGAATRKAFASKKKNK